MKSIYVLVLSFCLILAMLCDTAIAQEQWSDRWKETGRKDDRGKAVAFADTMILSTSDNIKVMIRKGNGFHYNGVVEGDVIDLGGKEYSVKNMGKEIITLGDEMGTYTLQREKKNTQHAEALQNMERNKAPEKALEQVDFSILKGKWTVYKRENKGAAPSSINYATQLNIVQINSDKDMQFFCSKSNQDPYVTFQKFEKGILSMLNVAQETKTFTFLKVSTDELIIEDSDRMVYFFKRF